jgi:hypothetical protein
MFCIARVGAQIYDTALISPVDRHSTDVTFNDVLLFRQPAVLNIAIRIILSVVDTDPVGPHQFDGSGSASRDCCIYFSHI